MITRKMIIVFVLMLSLSGICTADTGTSLCQEEFSFEQAKTGGAPMILYTGVTTTQLTMRSEPDKNSEGLGTVKEKEVVQIFGFDQVWLFCWREDVGAYYLGRHNVVEITPVSDSVPAYGVIRNRYVARTSKATKLYGAPSTTSEVLFEIPADIRFSFWSMVDGWAIVPYRRRVGYIHVTDLKDLEPVAPSVDYARNGDVISAFTTFYSTKDTELNIGRMENIRVGCAYIARDYKPGEKFDFNNIAGPYRISRGYLPSPVLVDGETVAGYGGGTCQVSTTLYNALLQLGKGINIVYRRPHGPGGASYAPHGVDAAVGASNLNLIFENALPFPLQIDPTANSGVLCICLRKV